jgi:hypothetical protein
LFRRQHPAHDRRGQVDGTAEPDGAGGDAPASRRHPRGRGRAASALEAGHRRGALRLLSGEALERWAPGTRAPHVPCVCGLVLEVGHLHKTRDILEAQGVETLDYLHDHDDDRPALRVDAAETHGIVLAFVEAEDRTHPQQPQVGLE